MSKGESSTVFDSFTKDDDAQDFVEYLIEAQQTDLTEIERSGCVSQGMDLKNNSVIIMIPSLGLNRVERPEVIFRKMLLLFLRKTHETVGNAYSIVYAHTNIDIMNQYPLIYKFYSILPRSYKKNLLKMYVVHPNVGIKMFFEFARVFLSHKFYAKLCLLDNILDFQRIVPPTKIMLPLKFLYREDEEREIKYTGRLAPLVISYDNHLGTTKLLDICTTFLRANNAIILPGIFRIPGDEGELHLVKHRLQYAYISAPYSERIQLSENKTYIIVGDLDALYKDIHTNTKDGHRESGNSSKTNSKEHKKQAAASSSSSTGSGGSKGNHHQTAEEKRSSRGEDEDSLEPQLSLVVIQNVHTVSHMIKLGIRDLPEALVSPDIYRDIVNITRQFEKTGLEQEWEIAITKKFAMLPYEHMATLIHFVSFLQDVGKEYAVNLMDIHNLSTVFAPTIFPSESNDPIRAVMELKYAHLLIYELLNRQYLLVYILQFYQEQFAQKFSGKASDLFDTNPMIQKILKHKDSYTRIEYHATGKSGSLNQKRFTIHSEAGVGASTPTSSAHSSVNFSNNQQQQGAGSMTKQNSFDGATNGNNNSINVINKRNSGRFNSMNSVNGRSLPPVPDKKPTATSVMAPGDEEAVDDALVNNISNSMNAKMKDRMFRGRSTRAPSLSSANYTPEEGYEERRSSNEPS